MEKLQNTTKFDIALSPIDGGGYRESEFTEYIRGDSEYRAMNDMLSYKIITSSQFDRVIVANNFSMVLYVKG